MTERYDFLCNLKSIFPYTICLPNGTFATAIHEGYANLSPKLQTNHLLYILHLQCNLVSVSQLVKEHKWSMSTNDELCYTRSYLEDADWTGWAECGDIFTSTCP